MLAAAGGFGSIYLNKEIAGKKHFTTWHGTFGLLTCLGVLLAAAGGVLAKYNGWIRSYVRPINVKLYHATGALLGTTHFINTSVHLLPTTLLTVFSLAMITMCLACYSNWFKNRVEGYLWRCMFWSPVILLICVARQVTQSYLPRVVKPTAPVEKRKSSAGKETKSH